jgi:hypothetical protein
MPHTPTPTMQLPLAVVQGYTASGRKQLPYVSIWLDQLTHAQVHGPERSRYAAHLVRCVNERHQLLDMLIDAVRKLDKRTILESYGQQWWDDFVTFRSQKEG